MWPSVAVTAAEAYHSLCSHPLFGLHKHLASVSKHQWLEHFPHGGTQWHTFASATLPYWTPFGQTAPLLPSVTHQQHVMAYWWEGSTPTAILPASTPDVVNQHNKTGGITFGAALVHLWPCSVIKWFRQICIYVKIKHPSESSSVVSAQYCWIAVWLIVESCLSAGSESVGVQETGFFTGPSKEPPKIKFLRLPSTTLWIKQKEGKRINFKKQCAPSKWLPC